MNSCSLRVGWGRKYLLGAKIGSGAFGDVFAGTNPKTNDKVAIKLENLEALHPQLFAESRIYRDLQGYGVPDLKWCGTQGLFHVLIIDLLGPSLEDLVKYCGGKFSLKTVLMIADQMICRLEFMHSRSYIHRDVKPDNFLIGTGVKKHIVHVIDFGLAKKYQCPNHIPCIEGKKFNGTARYASINTHLGIEQSRRDDMESLGFVLMYLLCGSLPWQRQRDSQDATGDKEARDNRILKMKQDSHPDLLCQGYPNEFKEYFHHCSSLSFEDKPDYWFLKKLFKDLFERSGFEDDGSFDWDDLLKKDNGGEVKDFKLPFQRPNGRVSETLRYPQLHSILSLPKLRLFIDVDHCIVKRYPGKLSHAKYWKIFGIEVSQGWGGAMLLVRPGLKLLLQECCQYADIYLLVTGESSAREVAQIIDPNRDYLRGFWGAECLTSISTTGKLVKDLNKLGDSFDPKRSVLIDDDLSDLMSQPHNGIPSEISQLMREPKKTIYDAKDGFLTGHTPSEVIVSLRDRMIEVNPLEDILADLRVLSKLDDVRPYLKEKYGVAKQLEDSLDLSHERA